MDLTFELEREADGRWMAEIPQVPGALAYGDTEDQAIARAEAIALRTLAAELEESGKAKALTFKTA